MYSDLCTEFGLEFQRDKLEFWSNLPGGAVVFDGSRMEPSANIMFMGALRGETISTAVVHRTAMAWNQCWAMKRHSCTRLRCVRVRLKQLRCDVFLFWGGLARLDK